MIRPGSAGKAGGWRRLSIIGRLALYLPVVAVLVWFSWFRTPAAPEAAAQDSKRSTGESFDVQMGNSPENSNITRAPSNDDNDTASIVGIDTIRDRVPLDPDQLYYFLQQGRKLAGEQVKLEDAPQVSISALLHEPGRYRFQPVAVKGAVVMLNKATLKPNPSGITDIYDGYAAVNESSGRLLCHFYAPTTRPLAVNDIVTVRGIFVNIERYNKQGGGTGLAPLVVAARVDVVQRGVGGMWGGGELLIVLLLVLLAVYVLLMFYTRRRRQNLYERLEARRKSVRARMRGHDEEELEQEGWQEDAGQPEGQQQQESEPHDQRPR